MKNELAISYQILAININYLFNQQIMIIKLTATELEQVIEKAYLDPKISPIIQRLLTTLSEKEISGQKILSEQDIKNIVGY